MNQLHNPDLNNGYYQNPVLFGNFSDPSILRDGEDYYMVHSGVGYQTMLMWHSKNLVNWEPLYYVLKSAFEDPDLLQQLSVWAPELTKVDCKYYIYNYTPEYGIWVVVTDDIKSGNWSKPHFIKGLIGIDPGHVVDGEGKRWIIVSRNVLYPLSEDGLEIIGEGKKICDDWQIPDEWDVEGICTESPKIIKRGDYYYLTVAEGGTVGPVTSHATISFRSKSIEGPYEASPYNPINHTWSRKETWWSKGHATLIDTPHGEWYIMYHAILNGRRDLGRMCLLEPVEWTVDGWFRIPGHIKADGMIPMPKGEKILSEVSISQDFKENNLGILWNAPNTLNFEKVSSNENGMELQASGSKPEDGTIIWFAPQHRAYEMKAKVRINKGAGVSVGYSFNKILSAGIAFRNNQVWVYCLNKAYLFNTTKKEVQTDVLWLKLINNDGIISPWYSLDGDKWIKINSCFEINDWSSNTGSGFGYVKPSIISFGEGTAEVSNFDYQVIY